MRLLSLELASVQTIVFVFILGGIALYSLQIENSQPLIPLPRKLTSSSFDQRKKLSVTSVAVLAQFVSGVFRLFEMAFNGGNNGYLGDTSRYERGENGKPLPNLSLATYMD